MELPSSCLSQGPLPKWICYSCKTPLRVPQQQDISLWGVPCLKKKYYYYYYYYYYYNVHVHVHVKQIQTFTIVSTAGPQYRTYYDLCKDCSSQVISLKIIIIDYAKEEERLGCFTYISSLLRGREMRSRFQMTCMIQVQILETISLHVQEHLPCIRKPLRNY